MITLIISIILGLIGMWIGQATHCEMFFGIIGFFCPSIYLIEKIYMKK